MSSQLGPDDCVANVTISMSENVVSIIPGTVCIECSVGGEVANDTVFQINGSDIDGSIGREVDGVLVVFDTESVFNTTMAVQCISISLNVSHSVMMFLDGKSCYNFLCTVSCFHDTQTCVLVFRPPVVTGMTTLNEGDTLYLDCDTSNSRPCPSVEWFSPEGVNISNNRLLVIMNIQRSAAGIYTCVATRSLSKDTINTTVNVTVQCECHY